MELLDKYLQLKDIVDKYNYALFIMQYDSTTDCPKNGVEYSYGIQQFFEKQKLDIMKSDEYKNTVFALYEQRDSLNPVQKRDIELEYKGIIKLLKIPKEEMDKHLDNANQCYFTWVKGREDNNYELFIPQLDELIAYNKRYAKYLETSTLKGYDYLLDEMEDHLTTAIYDKFFALIEEKIVPLAKRVLREKKLRYNPKLDNLTYSIDKQRKLTAFLANLMNYTDEVGCIRETIHPFTNGVNNLDVRITTNYNEKLLFSNFFSIMHEIGHAIYDLNHDDVLNGTNMFGGASCAIHESQSRFYENYLGRRKSFILFLFPTLKEMFKEELEGISADDLYAYVNAPMRQTIRVEADELTYPIHILIRYKIEKMIFNNEITAIDISKTFNSLMKEYLLIEPKNDTEGCFQDIHWSSGFAYFPTYALGSAFGAQFLHAMQKELDIDALLSKGDLTPITKWLNERIHHYGHMKDNLDIVKESTGEDFNPDYYINYLLEKFGDM